MQKMIRLSLSVFPAINPEFLERIEEANKHFVQAMSRYSPDLGRPWQKFATISTVTPRFNPEVLQSIGEANKNFCQAMSVISPDPIRFFQEFAENFRPITPLIEPKPGSLLALMRQRS